MLHHGWTSMLRRGATRSALLATCLAVLSACGDPPSHAHSNASAPLRSAFMSHAMACLDWKPESVDVLRTERSFVEACPGFTNWSGNDIFALDALRYGTILHVKVDEVVTVEKSAWGKGSIGTPLDVLHLKGRVLEVLKGKASPGPVEFPATARDFPFQKRFDLGTRAPHPQGGWRLLDREKEGLVFLPVNELADPLLIGCIEGHFVPTPDEVGAAYLRDMRQITDHLRNQGDSTLASARPDDPMLTPLLSSGGLTMGFFIADRCAWRTVLDLLKSRPPTSEPLSPLQLGLFEGALRMFELVQATTYSTPGWKEVDTHEVQRELLRWAIHDVALHRTANGDESRAWLIRASLTSGTMPPRDDLGIDDDLANHLLARIRPTHLQPLITKWLAGDELTSVTPHTLPWLTSCYRTIGFGAGMKDTEHSPAPIDGGLGLQERHVPRRRRPPPRK